MRVFSELLLASSCGISGDDFMTGPSNTFIKYGPENSDTDTYAINMTREISVM